MSQLNGIRVLDITRVLAGPLATQMLGDLGATVLKIERPEIGDESRQYGPPFLDTDNGGNPQESAFYLSANRNKKSIAVNFASATGSEIVRRLAVESDVFVENFRVGTLAKYGLDYKSLRAINPRIIYCSLTGFGQSGPYRDRPGYDAVFQAMGGLMSSIGYPDNHPFGGPLRTGLSITDVITSLYASIGILAALHRRDTNNEAEGEYIDMSLLDSTVAAMSHYASYYLTSGQIPPRRGNGGNGGVPSQVFNCLDGSLILTVGNDDQFARLCSVLGRRDLASDARFATGPQRIKNRDILIPILEAIFSTRPADRWLEALVEAEIPAGPINDLAAVFSDRQVRSRSIERTVPHQLGGVVRLVANPIRYARRPINTYVSPPLVGEHTESILSELLGYTAEELRDLRARGVI